MNSINLQQEHRACLETELKNKQGKFSTICQFCDKHQQSINSVLIVAAIINLAVELIKNILYGILLCGLALLVHYGIGVAAKKYNAERSFYLVKGIVAFIGAILALALAWKTVSHILMISAFIALLMSIVNFFAYWSKESDEEKTLLGGLKSAKVDFFQSIQKAPTQAKSFWVFFAPFLNMFDKKQIC